MPPQRNTYRTKYFSTLLWKNLSETVHEICTKCKTCQFLKRNKNQYRKLPPKEVETIPWDTLFVDLICKYKFTPKG